jgi:alkene monooxygenase coupling protein
MAELSDRLGRAYTVHDFLVNMTSYYGRIVVSDDAVEIHAEILPERFRG